MNDWQDAEQHVERAHEFYEASRWDEAESELREAIALNPHRADWRFNLGLTLEAAGRRREAIRAYLQAHRLEPNEPQTTLALGMAHLRLDDAEVDDLRQAVQWLEQARQAPDHAAEAQVHLIEAHARLNDHEQAELSYYLALQLEHTDHAMAHVNLADSLSERGLYKKAVWCLREAVQIDPDMPQVHARLASAYTALGRRDQARQLYLRELRNNPGDVDTLLDLGSLLVQMNRLAEAGEKFRRVLELESDHPDAHYELGKLAIIERRDDDAVTAFKLVLRLDPEYSAARRRLAETCLRRGQIEDARPLLRKDARAFRRDPDAWDEADLDDLGRLLLEARLPVGAARIFEARLRRRPDDAEALHLLAVAHFESGRLDDGVRIARQALTRAPDHVRAVHNIALAWSERGQLVRAGYWTRRALRTILRCDDSTRSFACAPGREAPGAGWREPARRFAHDSPARSTRATPPPSDDARKRSEQQNQLFLQKPEADTEQSEVSDGFSVTSCR